MSLSEDFGMYYGSTFVGYRNRDGEIEPFSIDTVSFDERVLSLRELSRAERERVGYTEEAMNALVFHGAVYNGGSYEARAIKHSDPNLVLELPDSKFVKIRNTFHWVSYRANRTTKKGLTQRRVCGLPSFTWENILEFLSEKVHPETFGNVFLKTGDDLRYKDVYIGKFIGEPTDGGHIIELFPEASHLSRAVSREIPNCQVTVQTEQA